MGVSSWMKETLLSKVGVEFLLNQITEFAGGIDGQNPQLRGVEYILLGLNDLSRGTATPDEAKSQIMTGISAILPLDYLAGFSRSDLGQKPMVQGIQAIISGSVGLSLGVEDREQAKRNLLGGIETILFPNDAPILKPAPALAPPESKGD